MGGENGGRVSHFPFGFIGSCCSIREEAGAGECKERKSTEERILAELDGAEERRRCQRRTSPADMSVRRP